MRTLTSIIDQHMNLVLKFNDSRSLSTHLHNRVRSFSRFFFSLSLLLYICVCAFY